MIQKILLITCSVIISVMSAQEYLSGEINRDTRWAGKIFIDGDIIVPNGITLTIEQGTEVFLKPKTDVTHSGKDKERIEIIVHGILLSSSNNPQLPILFTPQSDKPQMNDWYGITIRNFYEQSILKNCMIEFGYKGLTCYGSSPLIENCEFRFNHNSGISCEVKSSPQIRNTLLYGNGFAGINCELASSPLISGCTITQNNYGVVIFSRSQPVLGKYPSQEEAHQGANRVHNNFDYNVYNHSDQQIFAQNNFWNTSNRQEIQQTLYDKKNNSAYGDIIFEPLFFKRKPFVYSASRIALQGQSTSQGPIDSLYAQFPENDSGAVVQDSASLARLAQTGEQDRTAKPFLEADFSSKNREISREAMLASSAKGLTETPSSQPAIQEPVLEAFLDSGRREYIRKVQPEYPEIYRQTGTEGDVFIEVVIDREGNIENYRILKSDGKLFSQAALDALQEIKYKHGTIKGRAVKYKFVERFRFRISRP